MDVDNAHKVILVTSPSSAEGKSTTVCNLGLALAEAGTSVLILDADLRRPAVARYLGIDGAIGLTNVLVNRVRIEQAVLPLAPALDVLPSGLMPPNPSELLGSDRMVGLLAQLRRSYDVILIDAAPLLPVTDAAVLAPRADGVLIMVRHAKTRMPDVQAAKDSLDAVSGRILGSVLTMAPTMARHSYTEPDLGRAEAAGHADPVPQRRPTRGRTADARVPAPTESPEELTEHQRRAGEPVTEPGHRASSTGRHEGSTMGWGGGGRRDVQHPVRVHGQRLPLRLRRAAVPPAVRRPAGSGRRAQVRGLQRRDARGGRRGHAPVHPGGAGAVGLAAVRGGRGLRRPPAAAAHADAGPT